MAPGVLVLGMHRSGTSATAGALARMGFRLGDRLVPPAADNPKGYYEHAEIVAINDALFAALDRSWDDVRALPGGWTDSAPAQALIARAAAALQSIAIEGAWAAKDPRLCRLLPLWRNVFEQRGQLPGCLFVLRHPREVAASLAARDAMPPRQACLLWLRHLLEAEAATRGMPRTVVNYPDLVNAPVTVMDAALVALRIAPPLAAADAGLEQFVDVRDRHHVGHEAAPDEWFGFADRVYAHVCRRGLDDDYTQFHRDFEQLLARDRQWVATSGEQTRLIARVREQALATRAGLEARIARTDAALSDAQALCAARDREIAEAAEHLGQTQAALTRLEAMALERLRQLERADAQLRETQMALAEAGALCVERTREGETLRDRLAATELALQAAETLSVERLDELRLHVARLAETEAALAQATYLAVARLEQLERIEAQLATTSTALATAEALAGQRHEELAALTQRLQQTEAGLAAAERLVHEAQVTSQALDSRLAATEAALRSAETLAIGRLEELERLSVARDEAVAALVGASARITDLESAASELQGKIEHLEASFEEERARRGRVEAELLDCRDRLALADAEIQRIHASWGWRLYLRCKRLSSWGRR